MGNDKVTIYEYSYVVSRTIVIAAVDRADADAEMEKYSPEYLADNGDMIGVSDINMDTERPCNGDADDEAHLVTAKATGKGGE